MWAADAPVHECRWTEEAIKLDGIEDEPAWRVARVIDDFRFPWHPNDKKTAPAETKARLLWDREYLYIFADLDDADLQSHVTEHDGKIWNDDVLELFLKPADDKPGYYEFQVNPAVKLDMFIPQRSPDAYERQRGEGKFHFDAHVALRGTLNKSDDADRGWSVEGRIAWRDLMRTGGRPEPGETWRFALCRYDYAAGREPELSTCAPLSSEKPDFHRHEDYAKLRFIGPDRTAAEKLLGQQPYLPVAASRVIGSPDPPLPYRAVRAFANLKLNFPIAVYAQPGDGRLLIIDQAAAYGNSRIVRAAAAEFDNAESAGAESAGAIEVLLDLAESRLWPHLSSPILGERLRLCRRERSAHVREGWEENDSRDAVHDVARCAVCDRFQDGARRHRVAQRRPQRRRSGLRQRWNALRHQR